MPASPSKPFPRPVHGGSTSLGRRILRPIALLGLVAVLASACTSGPKQPTATPTRSAPSPTTSPSPTSKPGKFPLGKLTVLSGDETCPGGRGCRIEFEVSCPKVEQAARGTLVVSPALGGARGLVGILLGGLGKGFTGANRMFISQLNSDGFETVIISWVDSWLQAASGEEIGPARLACRSATAIKWVHDHLYQGLGSTSPALGACGFCLHGNSGGSSQIGYALSLYGLGNIVNAAVLSGGPPHAAIAKGCLQDDGYSYDRISAQILDLSWGFDGGGGPCELHDKSFESKWTRASLDDAGGTYKFPKTRIAFVYVKGDPTVGPQHGLDYLDKLRSAKSPYVTFEEIPGEAHTIEMLPQGRSALETALLESAKT